MGFIYNGISSQSMKIRARLTKWLASLPCAIPLKLCRAKRVLQILGAIYQNET